MVKVVREEIKIDGNDSTEKLTQLVKGDNDLIHYILTHTITFGGFNLMDMREIHDRTEKPIIAITERIVDLDSVKKALSKKFPYEYESKYEKILNAGNLYHTTVETAGGRSDVYFHCYGIAPKDVEELLEKVCIDSKLPESVRMAHLIGRTF